MRIGGAFPPCRVQACTYSSPRAFVTGGNRQIVVWVSNHVASAAVHVSLALSVPFVKTTLVASRSRSRHSACVWAAVRKSDRHRVRCLDV